MVYREIPTIARLTLTALAVSAVIVVVAMVSSALEVRLLDDFIAGQPLDLARVDANDQRQFVVGIASLVVSVLTVVLFLRWFYLANGLARDLGAELRFRPGWAVGYFFVPFLNLYRPVQAMHDLYRAAKGVTADRTLVTLWWIVFWVSGAVSRLLNALVRNSEATAESYRRVTLGFALSGIVDLLLVAASLVLVWRIASGLADRKAHADEEAAALPTL